MMTRSLKILLAVVFLAVCGPFLKNISSMVGIPNWLPLVRDPLILAVAVLGIARVNIFSRVRWHWLLLWLLLFTAAYMAVSTYQDRAVVGLYYLRFYLLPILFGIGAIGLLRQDEGAKLAGNLLRLLLWWNLLLFVISVAIYVMLIELPRLRPGLFGAELLPTAWYISGGTWMRMGLPASGPNGLGLVFALHALLILIILLVKPARREGPGNLALTASLGLALIGLVLTFSRSSILLFLLGGLVLTLTPGVMSFQRLVKLLAWSLVGLLLLVLGVYAFDIYSDGYIARWLALNAQGKDPSAIGHARSVRDAVANWSQYLMVGYPRGSVGPKAQLFTGSINNVESSWLGLLYDMGVFNALPYLMCIATLLSLGYRHRGQWAVLLALAGPFALLPYIFEADAVLYSFFIYFLAGLLLRDIKAAPEHRPITDHAWLPNTKAF